MSFADYLTVEDLLDIAAGVLPEIAVRDAGALAAAAGRPQSAVFGQDAYPTMAHKAAALMHSLARNHPLLDGNKRLAWSAARVFFLININGKDLSYDVDDAEAVVLSVAAGEMDVHALADWIGDHLS